MTTSLLLDRTTWDLVLDQNRNLAVCSAPYAVLQDVACAIRTFSGECWYDTSLGIPYFGLILGKGQSASVFKAQAEAAALTVDGVSAATCVITKIGSDRRLSGVIEITLSSSGETQVVGF